MLKDTTIFVIIMEKHLQASEEMRALTVVEHRQSCKMTRIIFGLPPLIVEFGIMTEKVLKTLRKVMDLLTMRF